jgi:hypothetical protein
VGLLLCAWSAAAYATPPPDAPTAAGRPMLDVNRVDSVLPGALDLERLGREDVARDRRGLPPRFAVPERVSITPSHQGTWEDLGDGRMLWRLRIIGADGTTSLNLGFTRYKMPPHGSLILYSTDGTEISKRFTAADNETHGQLWTPVVLTKDLMVELTVPKREARQVELVLGWINQGYRGFGTITPVSYDKSGSCNLDVACLAPGDSWRREMRSVAVISTGGSTFCTGSLINDAAGDKKMYFMTANHCGINSRNAASLVAYWNYQNSFCRAPGSVASGQAGDGTLTQFHTGSFFRAASAASDFTLVELDDPPVAAYHHFWAGWDRSPGNFACSAASPCATIHHPSTAEKRITYVTTPTATTSYNRTASPGDGTHLWVHWATDPPGPYTVPGVTEPGSSGAPLYSPAGRYIGQLHGGPSSCGATGDHLSDYFGRFSVSWAGGGTNKTRLSNWLDPSGTGALTVNGLDSVCTAISEVEPNDSRTAPQAISGNCRQISGTFLNDAAAQRNDYYWLSLPAGATVTGLLNDLSANYDLYIYNSTTGGPVASSHNPGTAPDQASWTNTGATAISVYVRVFRFESTRTTYHLKISY